MKLLVAHPGHAYSTIDVYNGLVGGLEANGHTILPYHLQTRISRAGSWLQHNYRRVKRTRPDIERPVLGDIIYQASVGLIEMALRELPDWVIVVTASSLHPDAMIMLRRAGAPLALLFTESPYEDAPQAAILQRLAVEPSGAPLMAFTTERASVEYFRAIWPNVHYLPHAYDPARHFVESVSDDSEVAAHDVVFVGSAFPERVELLSAVDWTGIDFALYGEWGRALPSRHKLRRYIRSGPIDNKDAAALYRRAKIGLNLYRQSINVRPDSPRVPHGESLSPRAYELAACGAFHLSEYRAEVPEVFGDAVPTFRSASELEALLSFYLERPGERQMFARALPGHVAGHTWRRRAREMLERLAVPAPEPTPALAGVF